MNVTSAPARDWSAFTDPPARARVVGSSPLAVRHWRVARVELVAASLGLGLITAVMCAAHVSHGGFYYDDWGVLALGRFPAPGGLLHGLWLYYGQRPGQVLYYAALDEALGLHAALRLVLAAAMVLIESTCLYALLRRLGLAAGHAFAIAALALTFPFSDSTWLWGILSLTSLVIAATLVGTILALRALESPSRRALAPHAVSLSLYTVGVLSYEVFAAAIPLAGLLYVRAVGLRRARARWALDVLVVCSALVAARTLLPIDVATPSRTQPLAGIAAHADLIAREGARLAGAAALPITGVSPWFGAGLLAAVLVLAALRQRHRSAGRGSEDGRWLVIAGAGVVLALAAWSVYVPAPDHYAPGAVGTVNRINAGAGIGVAVLVYSCLVLLARMLAATLRLPGAAAGAAIAAGALVLGAAYLNRTASDARAWDAAAADQRKLLASLHAALPRPGPRAVVYAFNAAESVGPGVPVLNTALDLTSAIRLSFSSGGLVGVPLGAAAKLRCGPAGPLADGTAGAYGDSYLVDIGARRAFRLTGHAQCELRDRSRPELHLPGPRFGVTVSAAELSRRERSLSSRLDLGRYRL
jgi:hypothetical protein